MNVKDVERHVAELEQDGYTIIPDVLSSAELEATREAMEEVLAAEEAVSRKFGLQTEDLKHSFNVQGKHRHFYGFLLRNPAPLEVARAVLGADMFCHDMAIRNPLPTGKKDKKRLGGNLHADWTDFTVVPFTGGKHFPMAVQSVWAISDFSVETGGTMIWPGSHLSNEVPPEEPETLPPGEIILEAPAGSVAMWDSALWHTGGINHSDSPRYALISYMQRWWIKGFNDAYHLASPEARAAMTDEERKVWGLDVAYPPNTHLRGMDQEQLAALAPEEKAVLNIPAYL